MPEIVSIAFKENGPTYYFDPVEVIFEVGDWVIVETTRGQVMGKAVTEKKYISDADFRESLQPVIRKASSEEIEKAAESKEKEKEALKKCAELVSKHELSMKLLIAEYNFDGSHLTVYFSSEGKVDFRALLKEMGSIFQTRVELRQIGARDAAKLLGGIGKCGRTLCCVSFLTRFTPISVRMARDQSLPLNPTSISGACGKLLCCLKYEHDQYIEMKKYQPSVGAEVTTPQGSGIVVNLNRLKDTVKVRLENDSAVEIEISQITIIKDGKGKRRGNARN